MQTRRKSLLNEAPTLILLLTLAAKSNEHDDRARKVRPEPPLTENGVKDCRLVIVAPRPCVIQQPQ